MVVDAGQELGVQDCVSFLVEVHESGGHDCGEESDHQDDRGPDDGLSREQIELDLGVSDSILTVVSSPACANCLIKEMSSAAWPFG